MPDIKTHNLPMKQLPAKQKIALIVFGLCLSLLLIETGLRIGGLIFISLQEYRNIASIRQKGTYRIICLGESTTGIGGKYSYPSQLEEVLNRRNIGIKFSVINKGLPGLHTNDILERLDDNLNKYSPDMVVAMIGINDEKDNFGKYTSYENGREPRLRPFFKSLRIYKLARLLWSGIVKHAPFHGLFNCEAEASTIETKDIRYFIDVGKYYYNKGEHLKAEEMFKNALAIDPDNNEAAVNLTMIYRVLGRYNEALAMLKKISKIDPEDPGIYVELIKCYTGIGDYYSAKDTFKKAVRLNKNTSEAYFALGWSYVKREKYDKAGLLYRKAIEIDPFNHIEYYTELTRMYDCETLEAIYEKAIEANPRLYRLYLHLSQKYYSFGNKDKAIYLINKAIEINQEDTWAYSQLADYYMRLRDYHKAEEAYKKILDLSPDNQFAYGGLAICYKEQQKYELFERYHKKVTDLISGRYLPMTQRNYQRLKKTLLQRGIKLACVQYPVRSVEPLKKMVGIDKDVIFVDNQKIFKDALKKASYDEYFTDNFGGDFGHCTPKGNRLLAENIADVILKECFGK